ncbi:uncharacterized protein LOC121395423 [Xenopus laevis]|uniref:Uncharacterized protein LOC121395423 n=1 Tax=Xenopus laevis TaxID=8355 RepID=A0A8J1L5R6_XENLA|nr:uncharacterized protein LOC121395423 [Xenopus laevis]
MNPDKSMDISQQTYETRSHVSGSRYSGHSSRSSASSAGLRARAKAEAARAALSYVEKEADMIRQKAELEANMHILQIQKAAVSASAEAAVYETAFGLEGDQLHDVPEVAIHDPVQRTQEYVQKHTLDQVKTEYPSIEPISSTVPQFHNSTYKQPVPDTSEAPPAAHDDSKNVPASKVRVQENMDYANPQYPSSDPGYHTPSVRNVPLGSSESNDLAKYLIRRELVSTGLLTFDDRPENYWAWKTSFQGITRDLNLTAREELDLLTKWLGPDSSRQAQRIRSVHVHNPSAGVRMVWQRLEDCYGSPEVIENALMKKLDDFPKMSNKDNLKLRELGDILLEVNAAKTEGYLPGLAYLDTTRGVKSIIEKLPYSLQDKWISQGSRYKEVNHVPFPPFSFFTNFIVNQAKIRNDPSFIFSTYSNQMPAHTEKTGAKYGNRPSVSVRRTEVLATDSAVQITNSEKKSLDPDSPCPIHRKPHPLSKCRGFRSKHIDERKAYLKENNICFKCCASTKHFAKDCKANIKCSECKSDQHISALHPGPAPWTSETIVTVKEHGGEDNEPISSTVVSKCTEVCAEGTRPRSCSKICLVTVYPSNKPDCSVNMYAVLDDQSNRSLAKSEFFTVFNISGEAFSYTLKTCSGTMVKTGRRVSNFTIQSIDGKSQLELPTLIECDMLPDDRSEIPTPEITQHFPHLESLADKIPALDPNAQILLLLGRDILRVHKVREQVNGPHNAPYAQRLDLGWVIVGEVCLGGTHPSMGVNSFKTNVLPSGRTSLFSPCSSFMQIKENFNACKRPFNPALCYVKTATHSMDSLDHNVFVTTPNDEKPATSIEDNMFLDIVEKEMFIDETNHWVAPLPFRSPRLRLPNNREQAQKRLLALQHSFRKKPEMKEHFVTFMRKIFSQDQAEPAPPLQPDEESWYLPIFGVYHPQKPGQIRVVFDSSSQYQGISLNDVLLSGPDLNNTLLGVLMRFRKEQVAVTTDVQQMFYCFMVREDHRNYLRFLWYQDNDLSQEISEFRMKVHVFGNSPSPAIATYGLRQIAKRGESEYGKDVKQFILRNFYVDDGLISVPTEAEAISLLQRARDMLAESNLKLHKVASNRSAVMEAFPADDRAKELKDLVLGVDPLPLQRSLGVSWNLQTDSFTFQVSREVKPFTRRGILATVNSLYDPLGFATPITVQGKALVRELSVDQCDWDTPLSPDKETQWRTWTEDLIHLEGFSIPRPYVPVSFTATRRKEVCVFSDASTMAIAAVAYLKVTDSDGQCHVGFIMGKSKLAPKPAHTVPRLELCAAVLSVELAEQIVEEMDFEPDAVEYYTDSKIVLGYIHNTSRRFYVYVSNRINRIRKSTSPDQWHYVTTIQNPADHGTRPIQATHLKHTNWFSGPDFLYYSVTSHQPEANTFDLVEPGSDCEIRPEVTALATEVHERQLDSRRFLRFSNWKSLVRGITTLIHISKSFSCNKQKDSCKGWHCCRKLCHPLDYLQAETVIVKCVQQEVFSEEIKSLSRTKKVTDQSLIKCLNPIIDKEGLLRVGGRLSNSDMAESEKHPLIIPASHHIATLLVKHYHEKVAHQGRHFTEGALRSAGLWITRARKLVSSIVHKCVICRMLRGKVQEQKMSDLPPDRLVVAPPFSHVGLDVFGPWNMMYRYTRGHSAQSKRWAVMFTCLSTRAVHLEVLESMSSSSFINALRRFLSIRGPVKQFRSDNGTNFVGACKELQINSEDSEIQNYLFEQRCTWTFNAPHSSHMGGVWERMIGIARRILDSMLAQGKNVRLSHEVLITLLAEVTAIMNARPLVNISMDPEKPEVLTPGMLLTQKACPISAPPGEFTLKDLYKCQWKQVQNLADTFWKRWKQEYLSSLQTRRKWKEEKPNVQEGHVVLLKDPQAKRNEWPMGLIVKAIPSGDGKVRKVEVKVINHGVAKVYLRPVSDLIVLFHSKKLSD